ncbi:MAG: AarF/UbiB family protein [Bacteriovoracia bacterium]
MISKALSALFTILFFSTTVLAAPKPLLSPELAALVETVVSEKTVVKNKKGAVDQVFEILEAEAKKNPDLASEHLAQVLFAGQQLGQKALKKITKQDQEKFYELFSLLGEKVQGLAGGQMSVPASAFGKKATTRSVIAQIHLVKDLFSIEEDRLLGLVSADSREVVASQQGLSRDLKQMKKQIDGLRRFFTILIEAFTGAGEMFSQEMEPLRQEVRRIDRMQWDEPKTTALTVQDHENIGLKIMGMMATGATSAAVKAAEQAKQHFEKHRSELAKAIHDAGPVFKKLIGQTLSNFYFVFPAKLLAEFEKIQDEEPHIEAKDAMMVLTKDLGMDPRAIFLDFDPEKPLKSGTVATTYEAKTLTGEPRIIKVQKPGVRDDIIRDAKVSKLLFQALRNGLAQGPDLPIAEMFLSLMDSFIRGFSMTVDDETNFRKEAEKIGMLRKALRFVPGVAVPVVDEQLTTERVLTMHKAPGGNIDRRFHFDDKAVLDDTVVDQTKDLSEEEIQARLAAYESILSAMANMTLFGVTHADAHAGNILWDDESGMLTMLDVSQIVESGSNLFPIVTLAAAFIRKDPEQVTKNLMNFTHKKREDITDQEFERFVASVRSLMERYNYIDGEDNSQREETSSWFAEFVTKFLPELTTTMITKHKLDFSPRFLLLARAYIPLTMTQMRIAQGIPADRLEEVKGRVKRRMFVLAPALTGLHMFETLSLESIATVGDGMLAMLSLPKRALQKAFASKPKVEILDPVCSDLVKTDAQIERSR